MRFPAYKVKPAYVRIYNDSLLKYSARVNYDVACPMHFEKYPVDIQRCNISFESWGHTNHYIVLSWLGEKRKFSSSIGKQIQFEYEKVKKNNVINKFYESIFILHYSIGAI